MFRRLCRKLLRVPVAAAPSPRAPFASSEPPRREPISLRNLSAPIAASPVFDERGCWRDPEEDDLQ